MQAPAGDVAWSVFTAFLGIVAIAVSATGWIRRAASPLERIAAGVAAALLFVPSVVLPLVGATLLVVIVAVHWRRA